MAADDVRWEGSRAFLPTVAMARAMLTRDDVRLTPEEEVIGRTLAGMLQTARPIVCAPEQLAAVSDSVFADLGEAFEYASAARLPFEVTLFDFLDASGRGADLGLLHFVEGGGRGLGFELRALVAGELPNERRTVFLPITGLHGEPPEELGAAFVDWEPAGPGSVEPIRWRESFALKTDREFTVTLMSVSAAMSALGEPPRAAPGALLGCIRKEQSSDRAGEMQAALATATASAVRGALKALYLLDSVNVELDATPVSRQVRRQAERSGRQIAWTIKVRAPRQHEREERAPDQTREYSHRFEVRGNFAHHKEGSWLYDHSDPEDLRPCPRCGRCRRVWRPAHVKGPVDRPLAIKIRRITFADESQ